VIFSMKKMYLGSKKVEKHCFSLLFDYL